MFANFKRRLITFGQSSKEKIFCLNPFITAILNVVVITIIFNSFGTDSSTQSALNSVLEIAFPIFILIGYVTAIGVYLLCPAQDRYDKTRYLLNFAGLRSSSYYVGILLADFLIFSISNVLLVISVFVL